MIWRRSRDIASPESPPHEGTADAQGPVRSRSEESARERDGGRPSERTQPRRAESFIALAGPTVDLGSLVKLSGKTDLSQERCAARTFFFDVICSGMRLVMDTSTIVAAMRSPSGASAFLLRSIKAGGATLLLSTALFYEYEAVCKRPEHRQAAGFTYEDVDYFLEALNIFAEHIEIWFTWRPQLRDPNDELVLEAAVNGRADAIVTFNQRDFAPVTKQFNVDILPPAEAIVKIRSRLQ